MICLLLAALAGAGGYLWLDSSFLNTAFTEAEQARILTTDVDNSVKQNHPQYHAKGGRNTKDKIFLLSLAEVWKYGLQNDAKLGATVPTEYTKTVERALWYDGRINWWLRSQGDSQDSVGYIEGEGTSWASTTTIYREYGVRPVMWIDLS